MQIAVICIVIMAMVLLYALAHYDAADDIAEEEKENQAERVNPCDTCLRWFECNGIDDDCPLTKERDQIVH